MPQSPKTVNLTQKSITLSTADTTVCDEQPVMQIKRPTTLELDSTRINTVVASTSYSMGKSNQTTESSSIQPSQHLKTLFRSNSSSLHKRQSTFVPATTSANNKFKLSSQLDQIFVISSNRSSNTDDDDDYYDSIEVIDERRMKNMPKSDRARLYKSNTFICEEYYTNEQMACVMNSDKKETILEEKRE